MEKSTSATKPVVTAEPVITDKRIARIKALEEKLKKARQSVKADELREEKKMYLPTGKAIVKKAKSLDIENEDIENYLSAGKILFEICKNLDATNAKIFLQFVEKYKKIDSQSFLKIKEILTKGKEPVQIKASSKVIEALEKKAQEFRIEPDNEEIPY